MGSGFHQLLLRRAPLLAGDAKLASAASSSCIGVAQLVRRRGTALVVCARICMVRVVTCTVSCPVSTWVSLMDTCEKLAVCLRTAYFAFLGCY